jgi:hypothetical protein
MKTPVSKMKTLTAASQRTGRGWPERYYLLNGGMADGKPTRMKCRAKAWEKCSR